jgi:hypothetical protein
MALRPFGFDALMSGRDECQGRVAIGVWRGVS